LTPAGWIDGGSVVMKDHLITDIYHSNRLVQGVDEVIDARGGYVMPGGVDIHVHGGGGRDFMEGSEDAFLAAIEAHRHYGTTSIMPTLSSSTLAMIRDAANTCERLMKDPMNGIIGLHLEGPYFNPAMAGGQMPENIRIPDPTEYKPIIEEFGCIKRWDASPEVEGALEFARFMRSKGVMAALAHTQAAFLEVAKGYEAGFTHATHFYNAMTGNHKEGVYKHEGTVESVYLIDEITVEMIADGIHVPPNILKLIRKQKGVERTALITDALACAASDSEKAFDPRVIVENGVCMLADRSAIAGSIATMDRLIRVCVKKANLKLEDVSAMASATPARLMGVYDRKGSLQRGKDADIIIMDEDLNLTHVIQMGRNIKPANNPYF
jgi:N-acetylglucosamine-6-phosphate deacetylase